MYIFATIIYNAIVITCILSICIHLDDLAYTIKDDLTDMIIILSSFILLIWTCIVYWEYIFFPVDFICLLFISILYKEK